MRKTHKINTIDKEKLWFGNLWHPLLATNYDSSNHPTTVGRRHPPQENLPGFARALKKSLKNQISTGTRLGYNLFTGLTTYLYRGYSYNPFTKYHGHPSTEFLQSTVVPNHLIWQLCYRHTLRCRTLGCARCLSLRAAKSHRKQGDTSM